MSHDLRDALDYSAVAHTVKTVVIEGKFRLIESAAERVAQRLIAEYGLAWVRVEVVKPITSEGYTAVITITRDSASGHLTGREEHPHGRHLVLRLSGPGRAKHASVRDLRKAQPSRT